MNQLQVKNAKAGRHGDGDGLYLLVSPTGARSWVLRVQMDGKRRDIGLGTADTTSRAGSDRSALDSIPILLRKRLSLVEAREKATLLRAIAQSGRDPIAERDRDRVKVPTFKEAALQAHAALSSGWVDKHAAAFLSSLQDHAFPALGAHRVSEIDSSQIRDMLAPIWTEKPVMAKKVRQRVSTVLNFAKSKGWRAAEAPGKSVTMGLARQSAGGNFAAMPYAAVPAFLKNLRTAPETVGRVALQLLVLTAARSAEIRSAQRSHFDLDRAEWNRPAELMKGRVAHTITLSPQAVALLRVWFETHKPEAGDLIFKGSTGKILSDMTMSKLMKDAGIPYTPHGFRSSFRDWAAEQMPNIPDPVAEAALAHTVADSVVRAYKRTQFLEMRRTLLDAWGAYLSQKQPFES
jgi:integrase